MGLEWKKFIYLTGCLSLLSTSGFSDVSYTVTIGSDTAPTTGGIPGDFRWALNQLIQCQSQTMTPENYAIKFNVATVNLSSTPLPTINTAGESALTIGNTSGQTLILGNQSARPFLIGGGNVTLKNLMIMQSKTNAGNGGAIFVDSANVILDQVSFISNTAQGNGGAIATNTGNLTFTNSCSTNGNTVLGRTSVGTDIFSQSGTNLLFAPSEGNTITLSGSIASGSGIEVAGGGTLLLENNNRFSGPTSVSNATLALSTDLASISRSSQVTLVNGDLDISGLSATTMTPQTTSLTNVSGSGNIFLGNNQLTIESTLPSTLSATIQDGGVHGQIGGSLEVVGDLTLSGENTFTGGTTVFEGILTIGNHSSLGLGRVEIDFGAMIQLQGSIAVENELTISGSGVNGLGAIQSFVGLNSITHPITISDDTTIGSVAQLDLSGINGVNKNLAFTGDGTVKVTGVVDLGMGSMTFEGPGSVTLKNSSVTSGATVNGGVLSIENEQALGSNQAKILNGQLEIAGNLSLINQVTLGAQNSFGEIKLKLGEANLMGPIALNNDANIEAVEGLLTIASGITGTHAVNFKGDGDIHVNGTIQTTSVSYEGDGTLTLSANNRYTGATSVIQGVLVAEHNSALSSSQATVYSGGELQLKGGIAIANDLILSGSGVDDLGALNSESGNNSCSGSITIAADTTIGSTSSLALNTIRGAHELNFVGAGNTTISGSILGASDVSFEGPGTLTLQSNNSIGNIVVKGGVLNVQNSRSLGTGDAVIDHGELKLEGNGLLFNNPLTLGTSNSSGDLTNVSGSNEYSGPITIESDSMIHTNGGLLKLSGPITGSSSLLFSGVGQAVVSAPINIGSGFIDQDGPGILTLSSANTYAGGTIISGGTIKVMDSSALGSGPVTIEQGGQLELAGGIEITPNPLHLNGAGLSGDGAIFSSSGINYYEGPIALHGATTIGAKASSTLTLDSINGNEDILFIGPGTIVVKSNINTGDGLIHLMEASNLSLLGPSTHTGGILVDDDSVLLLGNSAALGTGSLVIESGSEVKLQGGINPGNHLTLSGDGTSHEGALINGMGDNTYGGHITIEDDTTIGSQFGKLSISNTISGNHDLLFSGSGDIEIDGLIRIGCGSIKKSGNGKLILSGANTYEGTTIVTEGHLHGDSCCLPGPVHNSANLTFNQVADGTFNHAISGPGEVHKIGEGNLSLNGPNDYTGLTTVSHGRLSVNSIILGGVHVAPGATIGGVGTIRGGGTVYGTFAPGNSPGTLTIDTTNGNLVLDPSSLTRITITPLETSRIEVIGPGELDLGGHVSVLIEPGNYGGSGRYEILHGDYSGQYDPKVLTDSLRYKFELSYAPELIFLNYSANSISTSHLSGNALTIVNYLNEYGTDDDLFLLNELSGDSLQNAINRVSPSRNAFGAYISQQTGFSLSSLLTDHIDTMRLGAQHKSGSGSMVSLMADAAGRMRKVREANGKMDQFAKWISGCNEDDPSNINNTPMSHQGKSPISAWVSGFGEYAHQKSVNQNPSFHFTSEAILGGVDYQEYNYILGIGTGYAHTHFNEADSAGHGSLNYGFLSLYGTIDLGDFYIAPAIWGLYNQNNNTRNIQFTGYSETATAKIRAWQLLPHLEVGYTVQCFWADVIPFSSLDWAVTWQNGYEEHGASPFNAKADGQRSDMVRSETGFKFTEKWDQTWGAILLREKLSYVFQKPFGMNEIQTSFVGIPSSFTVTGVNETLNMGEIGLDFGLVMGRKKPVTANLGYQGEIGTGYWSNQLTLTLQKDF
jgi:autotransporter-associated beta strand protein/predicted outer membrane repeat protein